MYITILTNKHSDDNWLRRDKDNNPTQAIGIATKPDMNNKKL